LEKAKVIDHWKQEEYIDTMWEAMVECIQGSAKEALRISEEAEAE